MRIYFFSQVFPLENKCPQCHVLFLFARSVFFMFLSLERINDMYLNKYQRFSNENFSIVSSERRLMENVRSTEKISSILID
jgi:hypothetical protein